MKSGYQRTTQKKINFRLVLKQLFKLAFFYFYLKKKIKTAFLPSLPPAHPSPSTHHWQCCCLPLHPPFFGQLQHFLPSLVPFFPYFSFFSLSIIPIFPSFQLWLLLIASQRCHVVLTDDAHGCPPPRPTPPSSIFLK